MNIPPLGLPRIIMNSTKHIIFPEDVTGLFDRQRTILIRCFEYIGNDIRDKSLNESVRSGAQKLHKDIAVFLDGKKTP